MEVIMMRRDDFEEAIQEAALRGAELAIRKMPKDRPTQYNRVDISHLTRVVGKKWGVARVIHRFFAYR